MEKNRIATAHKMNDIQDKASNAMNLLPTCMDLLKADSVIGEDTHEIGLHDVTRCSDELNASPLESLKLRMLIARRMFSDQHTSPNEVDETLKLIDADPFMSQEPEMKKAGSALPLPSVIIDRDGWSTTVKTAIA